MSTEEQGLMESKNIYADAVIEGLPSNRGLPLLLKYTPRSEYNHLFGIEFYAK